MRKNGPSITFVSTAFTGSALFVVTDTYCPISVSAVTTLVSPGPDPPVPAALLALLPLLVLPVPLDPAPPAPCVPLVFSAVMLTSPEHAAIRVASASANPPDDPDLHANLLT